MRKQAGIFDKTIVAATSLLMCSCSAIPAWAEANPHGVLKGGVQQSTKSSTSASLSRERDLKSNPNVDPFTGKDETLDAPRSTFEPETMRPAKQQRPLAATIQQQGPPPQQQRNPMNDPVDFTGDPDGMPVQMQQPGPPPQQQPTFDPNDPDSSPDMQLAWDMWHKRVAQTIFERFNYFAKAAFKFSPPLASKVSYVVTRDGHITNLNMDQKSGNVLFNVLVFQCVKSLDGDANTLQFPQGSRRMFVQKYGTFAQNFGGAAGFKYTVNDRETVHGQQQQR